MKTILLPFHADDILQQAFELSTCIVRLEKAGSSLTNGGAADFSFLLVGFDPELLMPLAQFKQHLCGLLHEIKAVLLQPGVIEIRISAARAFAEREPRRQTGITLNERIFQRLKAL